MTSERARFLQVRAVLSGKDGVTPVLESISTAYLQRNLRPQVAVHHGSSPRRGLPEADRRERRARGPRASTRARARSRDPATARARPERPSRASAGSSTRRESRPSPGGPRIRTETPSSTTSTTAGPATTGSARFARGSPTPSSPGTPRRFPTDATSSRSWHVIRRETPRPRPSPGRRRARPSTWTTRRPPSPPRSSRASPTASAPSSKDDSSIIRKAEYSVDGGRWREVHPTDGINDALEESYEISLADLAGPSPHVVVVRATDLLGNVATARVEVP